MRVIEELIRHFWNRGSLTRDEAAYLLQHGFIRVGDLDGWHPEEEKPWQEDWSHLEEEGRAKDAEELEDDLAGRRNGKKRGGKTKVKPAGHDLVPLAELLRDRFFALREPYPALREWGQRLGPCKSWVGAADLVSQSSDKKLEGTLTTQLNARPRSLGELWYWFDVGLLFAWAEMESGGGPVAEGLVKIVRAATLHEVGRAAQLMKAGEVKDLTVLLSARRRFLDLLPRLYDGHFAKLGKWLVPPTGQALGCWPALPWAFVLVYNARKGTIDVPPTGYSTDWSSVPMHSMKLAFATAMRIETVKVRDLLLLKLRERADPTPDADDWSRNLVFDRPLFCPLNWRV